MSDPTEKEDPMCIECGCEVAQPEGGAKRDETPIEEAATQKGLVA
jgi:hypothetical protein